MSGASLGYESAATFHRVRSERRVHGTALAVVLGMEAWAAANFRGFHGIDGLILGTVMAVLALYALREAWALYRSRSAWEFRIAGERLYLRLAGEPSEQSVELIDVEHVMVAEYGTGKQRYTKVFLLLRDSRCWQIPPELLFPRGRLFRAIHRAASHVTQVTNAQMPERDPQSGPARTPPRTAAVTRRSGG